MSHSTTIITFDKPDKTYLPGDTVNGQVTITNTKPLKTRSVFIKWVGYSKTAIGFNPECYHYYFNGSKLAWASKSAKNEMPIGTHVYPFSFTLPKDSAPTFKRMDGRNKYKVIVEFDKPWWSNTKVKEEFRVTKNPEGIEKYRVRADWTWKDHIPSGWIFTSGAISINTTMPYAAFQPGETFDVKFDIVNDSGSTINGVHLQLSKYTHWHARHQQKPCKAYDTCHLKSSQRFTSYGAYRPGKLKKVDIAPYCDRTLTIPFTIPTEVQSPSFESGLMTNGYDLQVSFFLKGSPISHDIFINIQIGENLDNMIGKKIEKKQEVVDSAPPPYTA